MLSLAVPGLADQLSDAKASGNDVKATDGDVKEQKAGYKKSEVSYDELIGLIEKGTLHLFDVREPKELEETGTLPKAINIPRMHIYLLLYFLVSIYCCTLV